MQFVNVNREAELSLHEQVAAEIRRAIAEDGGAVRSALPAARLFRVNLEGCTYFWVFTAAVALLFWVLFYVV